MEVEQSRIGSTEPGPRFWLFYARSLDGATVSSLRVSRGGYTDSIRRFDLSFAHLSREIASAERLSMTRRPEEDSDVVCQQFRNQDGRDTWTIWLAGDKQADRTSLTDAIELARDVAVTHGRPAWLLDETGYPLKPMLPWAL